MSEYKQKALFYTSLAGLIENGISVDRALSFRFSFKYRRICRKMQRQIRNGATFTEAARSTRHFSSYELCSFQSGERMANLPSVMRALAEWYQEQDDARVELVSDCMYPLSMMYAVPVVMGLPSFLGGGMTLGMYMLNILKIWFGFPIVLYILSNFISFVSRCGIVAELLEAVPFIGNLFYLPDNVRYFNALSTGISAGMYGEELYPLAASCCRNGAYRKKFRKIGERVLENNMSYAEAFAEFSCAKDEARFIPSLLAAGEMVGHMDETTRKIADTATFDLRQLRRRLVKLMETMAIIAYLVVGVCMILSKAEEVKKTCNDLVEMFNE